MNNSVVRNLCINSGHCNKAWFFCVHKIRYRESDNTIINLPNVERKCVHVIVATSGTSKLSLISVEKVFNGIFTGAT